MAAPAGFGIIGVNFREEPGRTYAFAALGAGAPTGGGVGNILAGLTASAGRYVGRRFIGNEYADHSRRAWQYQYFIVAGVNTIPIIGGLLFIPREPTRTSAENRGIDWIGMITITVAISLLSFSVTQSGLESNGWGTPCPTSISLTSIRLTVRIDVVAVFAVSILMIPAFGLWEYYIDHHTKIPPTVKLGIFTRHHGSISAVLAISFMDWCGICVSLREVDQSPNIEFRDGCT